MAHRPRQGYYENEEILSVNYGKKYLFFLAKSIRIVYLCAMELKKKVIITDLDTLIGKKEDITEFSFDREVLDRIARQKGLMRLAVINDRKDNFPQVKAVEFFIFTYCQIAVSTHTSKDVVDEVFSSVPHSMRKTDTMIKVGGEKIEGMDYITREDFIR